MRFLLLLVGAADLNPGPARTPAEDPRVAAGEDIAAWREIHEGGASRDELREFLMEYPSSPLAERAWTELEAMDALPELDPAVASLLDRSAEAHQQALQREAAGIAVATLKVSAD